MERLGTRLALIYKGIILILKAHVLQHISDVVVLFKPCKFNKLKLFFSVCKFFQTFLLHIFLFFAIYACMYFFLSSPSTLQNFQHVPQICDIFHLEHKLK